MRRPAESIALIRQAAPDSEAADANEAGIREICGRMVDCVAAGTGETDQPLLDAAGSGVMDRCYQAASVGSQRALRLRRYQRWGRLRELRRGGSVDASRVPVYGGDYRF